jgi:hypothetical protein
VIDAPCTNCGGALAAWKSPWELHIARDDGAVWSVRNGRVRTCVKCKRLYYDATHQGAGGGAQ